MARRPENRRNRGRAPEGPLDWLKEPADPDPDASSQSGPLLGGGPPSPYAPSPYAPSPPAAPVPYSTAPPAPRADPAPRPDPGSIVDPRPHPDPAAPAPASPPLGRRAARERLQAQQREAQQARGAAPAPPPTLRPMTSPRPTTPAPTAVTPTPPREMPPWSIPPGASAPPAAGPIGAGPIGAVPEARSGAEPSARPDAETPAAERAAPERPPRDLSPSPRRRAVAFWLTVAALLLAAWPATMFVDSGSLLIAGPASIAPLVSVLALPVIAIGVASRHVVPTAIAVVAALVPWSLVAGYAIAGPGEHAVGTNQTLRVMSVDGADGRASAKDIVQATRLYEVDVVVVTDLTNTLAHDLTVEGLASLAPARWVLVPASGLHGTGLWSRTNVGGITPIAGLSRPAIDATVEAGTNRIGITVVHLAGDPLRPGKAWRSDLKQLAERPAPASKSLIVGDLNASPWQPAFRRLTKSRWRDAADVVGQGLRPTWPSWAPLPIVPVDHVLVTPGLGVSGADTTNIVGSSHRALIVTLVLPHAGG